MSVNKTEGGTFIKKLPLLDNKAGTITIISLAAFFTLIDLFGPQAIAPAIARTFEVSAPTMGVAVNTAVIGMIAAGFFTVSFTDQISRKRLMVGALAALSIPTALIAISSNLLWFEALRVVQGLLMCAAFATAIAYIAEEWGASGTAPILMGSYLVGNVAANMFGRMISGITADLSNWRFTFLVFASINLLGAILLQIFLPNPRAQCFDAADTWTRNIRLHLLDRSLCGTFLVGFLILFEFIGVFTYINFRFAAPPFYLSPSSIGLLYLVFLPSLATTFAVGATVQKFGYRSALVFSAMLSLLGAIITVFDSLNLTLLGLVLIGAGLFFSQAVATAFTGYTARHAKGMASGLYLASYYTGGLAGAWAMGRIFEAFGWIGCALTATVASLLMMLIVTVTWRVPILIPNSDIVPSEPELLHHTPNAAEIVEATVLPLISPPLSVDQRAAV